MTQRKVKVTILLICIASVSCANKLARVGQLGREVGKVAVELQSQEIADFRAGRIDNASHSVAQTGFEMLGKSIKALNSSIEIASAAGVRTAIIQMQSSMRFITDHISVVHRDRLQIWITVINTTIATLVALI